MPCFSPTDLHVYSCTTPGFSYKHWLDETKWDLMTPHDSTWMTSWFLYWLPKAAWHERPTSMAPPQPQSGHPHVAEIRVRHLSGPPLLLGKSTTNSWGETIQQQELIIATITGCFQFLGRNYPVIVAISQQFGQQLIATMTGCFPVTKKLLSRLSVGEVTTFWVHRLQKPVTKLILRE